MLYGFSSYRQQKVYTDNHSGNSACQRDSKANMTDLVSAEDNVNLDVSTGLSAAIAKGADDDVSLCVLYGFSSYKQQKVYTNNHSGISARQRDSKVNMTDLVSAEDDVNLRVSRCWSAAIDEGRRRRC